MNEIKIPLLHVLLGVFTIVVIASVYLIGLRHNNIMLMNKLNATRADLYGVVKVARECRQERDDITFAFNELMEACQ